MVSRPLMLNNGQTADTLWTNNHTGLDTSLMRPADSQAYKDAAVSAAPGPVVEPPQSSRSWTCFQENIGYEALTVPSGCANWSDRKLRNFRRYDLNRTTSCLLRSRQSSVPLAYIFLCSVKAQHIWLADHIKQIVNTVLVGQSFHNVPSHSITFPSVQNG